MFYQIKKNFIDYFLGKIDIFTLQSNISSLQGLDLPKLEINTIIKIDNFIEKTIYGDNPKNYYCSMQNYFIEMLSTNNFRDYYEMRLPVEQLYDAYKFVFWEIAVATNLPINVSQALISFEFQHDVKEILSSKVMQSLFSSGYIDNEILEKSSLFRGFINQYIDSNDYDLQQKINHLSKNADNVLALLYY